MPDMYHEVAIEASPEKIYAALTEEKGIKGWWTNRVSAQPTIGSTAEFGFYGGDVVFKFKVDKLEAGKKVHWNHVDGGPPDWAGTHVTWLLSAGDEGTTVRLGHHNYGSYEGSFATVNYQWAWFLTSLKQYIETGTGTPSIS